MALERRLVVGYDTLSAKHMKTGMAPSGKEGEHLFRDLALNDEHPEDLVPEDLLQLLQRQGRRHPEHALSLEAAARDQNMAVGIEAELVTEGLDGDDGARQRHPFRHRLLHEDLERLPGAAAELVQEVAVIKKVSSQHLRDAKDEMPAGNLLEFLRADPFPEFHRPPLMAGGAALAGEGRQVLVVAVFALDPGKAVAQIPAIQVLADHFPQIRQEESGGSPEALFVTLDEGFQVIRRAAVIVRCLRIAGSIGGGLGSHESFPREESHHYRAIVLMIKTRGAQRLDSQRR